MEHMLLLRHLLHTIVIEVCILQSSREINLSRVDITTDIQGTIELIAWTEVMEELDHTDILLSKVIKVLSLPMHLLGGLLAQVGLILPTKGILLATTVSMAAAWDLTTTMVVS